jgi:hypothetical protein
MSPKLTSLCENPGADRSRRSRFSYLDESSRLGKEPRLSGVRMSLLLTDGDEKPAAGEFFANIGRRQGGFLRGAV